MGKGYKVSKLFKSNPMSSNNCCLKRQLVLKISNSSAAGS